MTVMRNAANAKLPHRDGGPGGLLQAPHGLTGGHYFLSDCSVAGVIKEGDKKGNFSL